MFKCTYSIKRALGKKIEQIALPESEHPSLHVTVEIKLLNEVCSPPQG